MNGSVSLGKVSQIDIKVHWTFLLIFVWVIFAELQQGGSLSSILFNSAFILVIFGCVVLHELGHALMAKRFGVRTRRIMLLPIGGVASLEKIPEEPYQEFLVAIAGPLVNVCIAILLYFLAPVQSILEMQLVDMLEALSHLSVGNFFFYLFIANAGLVVFNLIPAFPMDGGRVLRAVLAMYTDRVKATAIAAAIGQFIAVVFLLLGFFVNIFLVFIALFVFIGAYGENKMVQHAALLKGHKVHEAMLTNINFLEPQDPMERAVNLILSGTERNFVVRTGPKAVGILNHEHIMKHGKEPSATVGDYMETDFKSIESNAPLQEVLRLVESGKTHFYPVTKNESLVGAIDMTNLNEFILLQSHLEF